LWAASSHGFIAGEAGFSGEAALSMAMADLGRVVSPAAVFELGGVDPAQGRGADAAGLVRAASALDAEAHLWTAQVQGDASSGLWDALQVLVRSSDALLLELGDRGFVVVRDLRGQRLRVDDPLVGEDFLVRRRALGRRWPQRSSGGALEVRAVTIRAPRELATAPPFGGRMPGIKVARRVRTLTRSLAGRGWPLEVVGPFILTGNVSPQRLHDYAESLVRMALDRLRLDFFDRDPKEPVVSYLFADDATYRQHTRELFGEEPETPYGYFDSARNVLVMNIATGGGTMVHEMIHPLLRANFPGGKPWLDEGLASLFEQSSDRDGHLVGLPNWRLPGLQHALRSGRAPSFAELFASNSAVFYGEERGTNYALARYLLYYFQERGELIDLWRRLVAGGGREDGGLAIVEASAQRLGFRDLGALRRTWESYVLALRYP